MGWLFHSNPFFSYFIYSQVFLYVPYLTVANLAQLGILVCCQVSVRSHYLVRPPSCAGLQVVIQSTHLSKDCYSQLVSNPHCFESRPLKQLDYRCMPLHPSTKKPTETLREKKLSLPCLVSVSNNYMIVKACDRNITGKATPKYSEIFNLEVIVGLNFAAQS